MGLIASIGLAAALASGLAGAAFAQTSPTECSGPVGDAQPGTEAWNARDRNNVFCATQRHVDQTGHPFSLAPLSGPLQGLAPPQFTDEYREPSRHDNVRFRFDSTTIRNRSGQALAAEVYRPCARGTCRGMPGSLQPFEPAYPAVIVFHGGGSRKELHWWSSQTLAEAGYMVVAFDEAAANRPNAEDVLDWLLATPGKPTKPGEFNPFSRELDRQRIGVAGHSMGGQLASVLGQEDSRISTIVSWDRGTNIPLPRRLQTPTLFFVADYACQANPVCQPEPYPQPPGGEGPGTRGREYDQVRAAGVDSMKVVLRATTHLDWTPSEPSGNRYGETVSVYYTLAWFDRYLKGDPGPAKAAFDRLTGSVFDDSADRHNISQGLYEPARAAAAADPYAGNVPYRLRGIPVPNLLSFYFRSKCYLTVPGSAEVRVTSDDLRREGCSRRVRVAGAGCLNPAGGIRRTLLGPAELGRTRTGQRRRLRGELLSGRGGIDRYCVRGGGVMRIGYPTRRLRRGHPRRGLVRRRRGRALIILTSSVRPRVRGFRVGDRVGGLRKRLKGERRVRVGRNVWYLAGGSRSRLLFKVRGGRVRELGIADRRLTAGRLASRRFLRAWQL